MEKDAVPKNLRPRDRTGVRLAYLTRTCDSYTPPIEFVLFHSTQPMLTQGKYIRSQMT